MQPLEFAREILKLLVEADTLVSKLGVNLVMTLSMPIENATDTIKKYI